MQSRVARYCGLAFVSNIACGIFPLPNNDECGFASVRGSRDPNGDEPWESRTGRGGAEKAGRRARPSFRRLRRHGCAPRGERRPPDRSHGILVPGALYQVVVGAGRHIGRWSQWRCVFPLFAATAGPLDGRGASLARGPSLSVRFGHSPGKRPANPTEIGAVFVVHRALGDHRREQ